MPNCPDPSTSSENIWYTEAISYRYIHKLLTSLQLWGHLDSDNNHSNTRCKEKCKKVAFTRCCLPLLNIKTSTPVYVQNVNTAEKWNPQKNVFLFCAVWEFLQIIFLIWPPIYHNMTYFRLHKQIWEKPLKKPHSPRSPGSGSWTLKCWWTAPLEKKTP